MLIMTELIEFWIKIQQKQDYCEILQYYNLKELLSILNYCKI